MAVNEKTKRLAMSALLAALGVVAISVGSFIQVMDISMAVVASVFCIFAVIEYGGSYPWLVYAVTGVIALIVSPYSKEAAAMYVLFFGYYPIIKEKLEKRSRLVSWVLKEVVFNVALAVMLVASKLLLTAYASEPWYMFLAFALLAEVAFPIYDLALTRLITLYIRKIRGKLKIK